MRTHKDGWRNGDGNDVHTKNICLERQRNQRNPTGRLFFHENKMFDGLRVRQIPVPRGDDHPPPPHGKGLMPIHEFTMGLIAPKGKGKTTTAINMLANGYKNYFHQIYIFSPTVKSDSKWDWLKRQPILIENKPLKKWILEHQQNREKNSPIQPLPLGKELDDVLTEPFRPEIADDRFLDVYDPGTLATILDRQKKIVAYLKDHGKLKTFADRLLIIFDDQVGSELFSGPMKKYFVGVNTRHRHYSASFIMMSQGYKEIPKTIRTGWTCALIYKIGNMKEVEVIYEEFQMDLNFEEWFQLYQLATTEKHDFLFLDYYADDGMRMRRGFDQGLVYQE